MGDWWFICLMAILAGLMPAGKCEDGEDSRRCMGTGGWDGAENFLRQSGRWDFEYSFNLAAESVAAR